jgi:hypothetical protein
LFSAKTISIVSWINDFLEEKDYRLSTFRERGTVKLDKSRKAAFRLNYKQINPLQFENERVIKRTFFSVSYYFTCADLITPYFSIHHSKPNISVT